MSIDNGLHDRGTRLWASLLAQDAALTDEDNPMRELALTTCRTADRVDALEALSEETPATFVGSSGPMMHPLYAELRQQSALLARLVVALRMPDIKTGKRPQVRSTRGVTASPKVSSIDRLRSRTG